MIRGDAHNPNGNMAKLVAYNEALIHAVSCKELFCNTHGALCQQIKIHLDHFNQCKLKQEQSGRTQKCSRCKKMCGVMKFHAKCCSVRVGEKCSVGPACDFLREYSRIRGATKNWKGHTSLPSSPTMDDFTVGRLKYIREDAARSPLYSPTMGYGVKRGVPTAPTPMLNPEFSSGPGLRITPPPSFSSSSSCSPTAFSPATSRLTATPSDTQADSKKRRLSPSSGLGLVDESLANFSSPTSVSETSSVGGDDIAEEDLQTELTISTQSANEGQPCGDDMIISPTNNVAPHPEPSVGGNSRSTLEAPPATASCPTSITAGAFKAVPKKRFFPSPRPRSLRVVGVQTDEELELPSKDVVRLPKTTEQLMHMSSQEVRACLLQGDIQTQRLRLAALLGLSAVTNGDTKGPIQTLSVSSAGERCNPTQDTTSESSSVSAPVAASSSASALCGRS